MDIQAPAPQLHVRPSLSRRRFVATGLAALAAPSLAACFGDSDPTRPPSSARLSARPGVPVETPSPGASALGIESGRDGLLFVPDGYQPDIAMPLLVLLHGAGGAASDWQNVFAALNARGIIGLVPDSRGATWDRARGDFGADVGFLDAALAQTFRQCRVDPSRVALGGFSDGASYALSLGVGNGDLFTHLAAFSPGFVNSGEELVGKPVIFVSHGTQDPVLDVRGSRDQIVPLLQDAGYDVTYVEFDGGHEVPSTVFEQALDWFTT